MTGGRTEIDTIFTDCIRLPVTHEARAELDRVLSEINLILHDEPDAAVGAQNAAFEEMADAAYRLRVAILKHEDALPRAVGHRYGRAIDHGGVEHRTWRLLHSLAHRDLATIFNLKFTHTRTPPRGGQPVDTGRLAALTRAADYWTYWTGEPPKPSRTSRFSQFAVRIFVALGFGNSELDLRRYIRKIAARGTNLET